MRCIGRLAVFTSLVLFSLCLSISVSAQCPDNRLANAGFEEGEYKTESVGTSLSSGMGNGWMPWSILGDAVNNREVEYKVLAANTLPSRYHIHGGNHSQKFFTTWGTHTAGFFQRVKVVPGSEVTFSIWAQIYTGERELSSADEFISDLDRSPGNYRVFVGIDPRGDTPPGFGAPPSPNTVWSPPVLDRETRIIDEQGHQVDRWVQLSVSVIAQSDYVTVYTKGQPEFPVKHNDSFWDDACLIVVAPPSPTPMPTPTWTATPPPTETPIPTETSAPTATVMPPTATPLPPTETAIPDPTATGLPLTEVTTEADVAATPTTAPGRVATPCVGVAGSIMLTVGAMGLLVVWVPRLYRRRRG